MPKKKQKNGQKTKSCFALRSHQLVPRDGPCPGQNAGTVMTGRGEMASGNLFLRAKFRHTSNVGAGPSDTGNVDTPRPRSLVDNQVRETLAGRDFEQHPLLREDKRSNAHGGCTRSRKGPKLRKKVHGENFDTKVKSEVVPADVSPDEVGPLLVGQQTPHGAECQEVPAPLCTVPPECDRGDW